VLLTACAACTSPKGAGTAAIPTEAGAWAGRDGGASWQGGAPAGSGGSDGVAGGVTAAGVRWIGRVDLSDPAAPRFAWSGTGFAATVTGSAISVKLRTVASSDPIYFQPVIDGAPGARFAVATGARVVTLASGLAPGAHAVALYRETEGRFGDTVFEGFTGGVLGVPPASPGRFIEIVGDSISAGYGDLGSEQHPGYGPDPDGGCVFSTQTESAYATYGALAARALGADPSILAVSGWGMSRDNGSSTGDVLPLVYADTLGLRPGPTWGFRPEPQAVVVNLGTNDFAGGDPGQAQFEGAYGAFIATLRAKYPDAYVFCAVGPLLYGPGLTMAQAYVQDVVASARARGDARVKYLDLGTQNISLGTGCQYHPSTTEHQAMATTLEAALRSALGW
jgi:Carbohydrate esterase 2 N-terminal/GDSL-like Lipase/Acylhydrolase family